MSITTTSTTTMNNSRFDNANDAYEYLYEYISLFGVDFAGTKAIFNVGFYIENPMAQL